MTFMPDFNEHLNLPIDWSLVMDARDLPSLVLFLYKIEVGLFIIVMLTDRYVDIRRRKIFAHLMFTLVS